MSPLSLLFLVAGGICLVLAVRSFRKPRMIPIDRVNLPSSLTTLDQLRTFLLVEYKVRFPSAADCDWWIRRNVLAIRYEFERPDETCPLYDDIIAQLEGAKRSEEAENRANYEKAKADKEVEQDRTRSLPETQLDQHNEGPENQRKLE